MQMSRGLWVSTSLPWATNAHGQTNGSIDAQTGDIFESAEIRRQTEMTSQYEVVTPEYVRMLDCLMANQGKVSARCGDALHDTSTGLEWMLAALTHVSSECCHEMKKCCAAAQPAAKQPRPRCSTALRDSHAR
jgi:hypothetical protein